MNILAVVLILGWHTLDVKEDRPVMLEVEPGTGIVTGTVVLTPKATGTAASAGRRYQPGRGARQQRSGEPHPDAPVLVWLEADHEVEIPSGGEPAVLDQVNLQFSPRLMAIRQDESVRFLNSDPVYHNVFSLSRAKRFDIGRRPQGEYMDVVFDRPGVVEVFCDIHSNMHAVIYVLGNNTVSWSTVRSDRPFSLTDIPAGSYTLRVYSPGYNEIEKDIEVAVNSELRLGTLRLD